ncbi:hypothetical protein BDN70DRAFT_870439 [Pholiota conissans]|uniref:N-acetyl-D-glucosamine kinase n=1 Tax=Pholiota conissans TaxID=109636 RepID=A0A9P6D7S8_9AGAR|nr:hypothetical protein BDN70DRAFT_870439 [Pholiota conissans]
MALYLCVDCGGTKTAAAICDADGTILGRGSGGPSNITYLAPEAFIVAVTQAVNQALLSTPTPITLPLAETAASPFAAAWFGVSGADSPAAIAKVAEPLAALLHLPLGQQLAIANDTHLLAAPLRMYTDVRYAVTVIAGTGSIGVSFREGPGGRLEELGRVGGWGWILGDEGGGYDVGREAIRQILLAQDTAQVTGCALEKGVLIASVLDRFGVEDAMEILTGVYTPDPAPGTSASAKGNGEMRALRDLPREKRVSSLSPLVFDAAFAHEDPFALNILKTSAGHLAQQVALLLGEGVVSERVVDAAESVVCFGGSLVGVPAYRQIFLDSLASKGFVFRRVVFVDDAAAVGAKGLAASFKQAPV